MRPRRAAAGIVDIYPCFAGSGAQSATAAAVMPAGLRGPGAPNPRKTGVRAHNPRTARGRQASRPRLRGHGFAATVSRPQLRGQVTDGLLTILLDIFKLDPWM